MQTQLTTLRTEALTQIAAAATPAALEETRVRLMGKKGSITALLHGMRDMDPEERKAFGAAVNALRDEITRAIENAEKILGEQVLLQKIEKETLDVTWPAQPSMAGGLSPMTRVQRLVESIFLRMGFDVIEGREVEDEAHNFELLNVPAGHPARDMQDTFWLRDGSLLRTQTSSVQARYMTKNQPPIRIVCPGRVYRCDEVDASHSPVFHQMEGLVVDRGVTMAHLRGALDTFAQALYGETAQTRFRPSYFPFTEPSAEVDVSCTICEAKGCKTCKGSGWIEILGAGMVHPRVLTMCGIDPEVYTGYAFGVGLERIAMLKYGISDMRWLYENDMRFVRQFDSRKGD